MKNFVVNIEHKNMKNTINDQTFQFRNTNAKFISFVFDLTHEKTEIL